MSDVYKIVEIEGKGLGCIATKDIQRGDLILREKPQLSNANHLHFECLNGVDGNAPQIHSQHYY